LIVGRSRPRRLSSTGPMVLSGTPWWEGRLGGRDACHHLHLGREHPRSPEAAVGNARSGGADFIVEPWSAARTRATDYQRRPHTRSSSTTQGNMRLRPSWRTAAGEYPIDEGGNLPAADARAHSPQRPDRARGLVIELTLPYGVNAGFEGTPELPRPVHRVAVHCARSSTTCRRGFQRFYDTRLRVQRLVVCDPSPEGGAR